MRFLAISDNHDTAVGMRLSGIESTVVHTAEEVEVALKAAVDNEEIGIVLITRGLVKLCRPQIDEIKLKMSRPLIVEVPDRHIKEGDAVTRVTEYVREAIGIKL